MQFIGFIALIIVVVLGVAFAIQSRVLQSPEESPTSSGEAPGLSVINEAKEAARAIERGADATVVIYDGITVSVNETNLDLSGRNLSGSLKAEIWQVGGLTTLDVSDNNFTGLPAEVGQLTKLERLDLSNNPLTGLPQELGNLSRLQVLDLRGTKASAADVAAIRAKLPTSTEILID